MQWIKYKQGCDGRERRREQTFVVERVDMRGEGRTNVCGADGAFKND